MREVRRVAGTMLAGPMLATLLSLALAGCAVDGASLPDLPALPDLPDLPALPALAALGDLPLPGDATPGVDEARAAATDALEPKVSASALHEEGFLTVGLAQPSAQAPYCMVDKDGAARGLDVDVASALADELGLKVRFVTAGSASAALANGCDVVMGVRPTGEATALAGTYAQTACGVFSLGDAAPTAEDLAGGAVGVQGSSSSARTLASVGLATSEREYANLNDAFDALAAGEVDYVACEVGAGAYLAPTYEGVHFVGILEDPTPVSVATDASNAELADAVTTAMGTLRTNGVLDVARARWVGSLPTLTAGNELDGLEAATAEPTGR